MTASFHNTTKKTTQHTKRVITILSALGLTVLSACASKNLADTSTQYYHAPAQAYNLFLGNAAITGQPTLRESCSENGSTLEIIDSSGDFFRVDVINLKSAPGLITGSKESSAKAIGEYFYQLYGAEYPDAPVFSVPVNDRRQLYISLPLDHPGPIADKGRVVGMLVSKYDDFLFSVQHVQKIYNQEQMLTKLKAMQTAMSIPGRFVKSAPKKLQDNTGKEAPETLGFIKIDPTQASAEEIASWRQNARC